MLETPKGSTFASLDQPSQGTKPPLIPFGFKRNAKECAVLGSILPSIWEGVSEALCQPIETSLREFPTLGEDAVVVQETPNSEVILTGSSVVKSAIKQSILSCSSQSELEKVDNIPTYLNIEPSLAMDWLEISWDDLRIRERVGAGNFFLPLLVVSA